MKCAVYLLTQKFYYKPIYNVSLFNSITISTFKFRFDVAPAGKESTEINYDYFNLIFIINEDCKIIEV